VFAYRPIKQLFTEILNRPNATDEQKRSEATVLAEEVLAHAHKGEPWAVHLIYERVEGRVPNVIRTDTRRRYEELDGAELRQAIAERVERLGRSSLPA